MKLKNLEQLIDKHIEQHGQPEWMWTGDDLEDETIAKIIRDQSIDQSLDEVRESNISYTYELESAYITGMLTQLGVKQAAKRVEEFMDLYPNKVSASENWEVCFRYYRKVPVRIIYYSNYDCMVSHHSTNNIGEGYTYEDNVKQILDILNMNPQKFKQKLIEEGFNVKGRWANHKEREGKEFVDYELLKDEFWNNCCCSLLTIVGYIDIVDFLDIEKYDTIIVPKGNYVGLFDESNGGGSMIEAPLLKSMRIKIGQYGITEYDDVLMKYDYKESYRHSIGDVYGVTGKFWGNKIKLIKSKEENENKKM